MLFFRATTDHQLIDCSAALKNLYGGVESTACFIIGSSPISQQTIEDVNKSPLMKLSCNLSGRDASGNWSIKPDIWTAYDPSARFPRSIYADPSIMKFIGGSRTHDLVSDGDEKMCDMPNTFFYQHELREFNTFFDQSRNAINNSLDSFIQILDIGYMLGFRTFICVGTELAIRPSEAQIAYAESVGVKYDHDRFCVVTEITVGDKVVEAHNDLLSEFVSAVSKKAFNGDQSKAVKHLESLDREQQYSFSEIKSLNAAIASDRHYFDRAQYLRLSRKCMSLSGVNLYCTSHTSRLFPYFEYVNVGSPFVNHLCTYRTDNDDLTGLYTGRSLMSPLPFHRDVKPYDFPKYLEQKNKPCCGGCADKHKKHENDQPQPAVEQNGMVLQEIQRLKNADVVLKEEM